MQAEGNALQEPEALLQLREEHERETVWGETLMGVSEALSTGKRWVWDEAGRKVSLLLSSPAAFQGEHFLQVNPLSCSLKPKRIKNYLSLIFDALKWSFW